MLGSGCILETWEPTLARQLPLSMGLTNLWSTTLYPRAAGKEEIFTCLVVRWYINNNLHLVQKYARIFVCRHYLFWEANGFLKANLEENCELRGTYHVQGQIYEQIFTPNGGYYVYYPSNILQRAGQNVYEQFTIKMFAVWDVDFSVFSGTTSWTNKDISSVTEKCSPILNSILNKDFHCIGHKVWKLGNITWGIWLDISRF